MNSYFLEALKKKQGQKIFSKPRFFDTHKIQWKHVIDICVVRAPAMFGCYSGFLHVGKKKLSKTFLVLIALYYSPSHLHG